MMNNFLSFFHFLHPNVPDNKCHKQKWHVLFFTHIKLWWVCWHVLMQSYASNGEHWCLYKNRRKVSCWAGSFWNFQIERLANLTGNFQFPVLILTPELYLMTGIKKWLKKWLFWIFKENSYFGLGGVKETFLGGNKIKIFEVFPKSDY